MDVEGGGRSRAVRSCTFRMALTAIVAAGSLCLGAAGEDPQRGTERPPSGQRGTVSELQRAAEVFREEMRTLGRAGGRGARTSASRARFHGRVFWNFRNDFLDAVPHQLRQRDVGYKNPLRRNQFGFNLSGPVRIPKIYDGGERTFFSVSYEGVREGVGRSNLETVPIVPERSGDFSQTVDQSGNLLPIFDPSSTSTNPNYNPSSDVTEQNLQYVRDPFPGNRIPTSRLDPVALAALNFYPAPNANAGPFFQNNYFVVSKEHNQADGVILKLDHNAGEKNRFAVGYSLSNGTEGSARLIPNAADSASPDREYVTHRASVEHVYSISPQSVNTLTFDFSRTETNNTSDQGNFLGQLGLGGVSGDVFPRLSLGSYLSMGRVVPLRLDIRNTFEIGDSFSIRRGKHNLRLSAQVTRQQVNVLSPAFPVGLYRFSDGLTSLPGIVNTGHAFASFLLGLTESAEVSSNPNPSYWRKTRFSIRARERYDLKPGLAVNLGVNLDAASPRTEKFDRQSTVDRDAVDPVTGEKGALVFAGRDGRGSAFQPFQIRLEPRASLAWSPHANPKTVIRLSWALNFIQSGLPSTQWGTQGFTRSLTFTSANEQLSPAFQLRDGAPPPDYPVPDLRPNAADGTVANLVDQSSRIPVIQEADVSVERQLPSQISLVAGFSDQRGHDMDVGDWVINLNPIPLDDLVYRDQLNDLDFRQSLRPYPQYLGFSLAGMYPLGRYQRDAGYLRLEKRLSGGLSLNARYEYSKQFDDYSSGRQDFFNAGNEWSLNARRSAARIFIELCLRAAYRFKQSPAIVLRLAAVPGGRLVDQRHELGGIRRPAYVPAEFNNTGQVVSHLRVNVVPGVDPHVPDPSPESLVQPGRHSPIPPDFTIGDASPTDPTLRGPIRQNHDLSLTKRLALTTEQSLEFTASAFNFFNHANWNDPDTVIGTEDAPNLNAGKIIGSRGGRVIQLGLRYSF